jgi:hypothetical protein
MTDLFEGIIRIFDLTMTTPTSYGLFHLGFVALSALVCFLLCIAFKNPSEKTLRKILLIHSLICIVLEIYKQISFTFDVVDGAITHGYQWYAFPFQFCSIPIYVSLIAALVKNKKVFSACIAFLSTFGMIAGILVMAYPTQVFIPTIGINIQTMIHHGSQITIGLFLLIRAGAIKTTSKTLGGVAVFLVAVGCAMLLNLTVIHFLPEGTEFNMFYISPYFNCSLPVYSTFQQKLPYPVFLLLYLIPFIALSLGLHAAIYKLPGRISRSKKEKNN